MVTQREYELLMGLDYSDKPFGSVEYERPTPTWNEYWREQTDRHLAAIDPSSDMGDLDRTTTLWGNFAPGSVRIGGRGPSDYMNLLSAGRKKEGLTAAIKDPVHGKIYTGEFHPGILDELKIAADMGQIDKEWVKQLDRFYMYDNAGYGKSEMDKLFGFVNDAGEFFTRHDAAAAFGADEASSLYRRIRRTPPQAFGERPLDNPVNPNPVKPKKAKAMLAAPAATGLAPAYEPDYGLLMEGAYDEPVQPKYLLDLLKKGVERFAPSGPDFPVPNESLGIRGEVQGISPTPPEPGRNLLEPHIPGTRSNTALRAELMEKRFPSYDSPADAIRAAREKPLGEDEWMMGVGVANLRPVSGLGDMLSPQMAGMVRQSEQAKYLLDILKKAKDKFSPEQTQSLANVGKILKTGGEEVVQNIEKNMVGGLMPSQYVAEIEKNIDVFRTFPIDKRIAIFAQLERVPRDLHYSSQPRYVNQVAEAMDRGKGNIKVSGGNIVAMDTIRGCENDCLNCFGLIGANKANITHGVPERLPLKGHMPEGKILRIGEMGDPATDWKWSNEQVNGVFANSPKANMQTDLYAITKLQNIDGFDPKIWRNIEVSLDPLNPQHLATAKANVQALKQMDPTLNIVARIRSLKTNNPQLAAWQEEAKQFARDLQLPVLNTQLRFRSKAVMDLLELDKSWYKKEGPQFKLKQPVLTKEDGFSKLYLCGEKGGKCPTCRNCERLIGKLKED